MPETEATDGPKRWVPPTSDQEFVFKDVASIGWADKNWASYSLGPALAVPAGDLYDNTGPYTTNIARVGDTVKFIAAKGATPGRIVVIAGEPDPAAGGATKKLPQVSNASLEDALKSGAMTPDDLGDDAKAQVSNRSPGLRALIEEGAGAPEPQNVGDTVKVGVNFGRRFLEGERPAQQRKVDASPSPAGTKAAGPSKWGQG